MHALFSDPRGPKVWRLAPYALTVVLLLFAMFGPLAGVPTTMTVLAAFAGCHALGLFNRRQRKPRPVDLVFGTGAVIVTKGGSRNQRIDAKDVTGATTAGTKAGFLLTLQHRRRQDPITLVLTNETEADEVRQTLGIGHAGFGTIEWSTQGDLDHRGVFGGRVLAAAFAIITMAMTFGVSPNAGLAVGILLGLGGVAGTVKGLVDFSSRAAPPNIVMTNGGLQLLTPGGWFAVPYLDVEAVADHGSALFFSLPEPHSAVFVERGSPTFGGPSAHDAEVIVGQISAAAQRARGLGQQKSNVMAPAALLRRKGEQPGEWLARLDIAGQTLGVGPGYRSHTVDAEELWTILEDPDADAELRAAAARVLRHSPAQDTRSRIDGVIAAVRDDATDRRLRIFVRDDLDSASQELARLDASAPPLRWDLDPTLGGAPDGSVSLLSQTPTDDDRRHVAPGWIGDRARREDR